MSTGQHEWPYGEGWPSETLPQPSVVIELAPIEVGALIAHHEGVAAAARARHDDEAEHFHSVRASYLRQRLGAAALHTVTPDREGHA